MLNVASLWLDTHIAMAKCMSAELMQQKLVSHDRIQAKYREDLPIAILLSAGQPAKNCANGRLLDLVQKRLISAEDCSRVGTPRRAAQGGP